MARGIEHYAVGAGADRHAADLATALGLDHLGHVVAAGRDQKVIRRVIGEAGGTRTARQRNAARGLAAGDIEDRYLTLVLHVVDTVHVDIDESMAVGDTEL